MLGDGVWLRFAVEQHGFWRCQINFAGDVVLDVVEVCHPVAFKHGKAVLEIVLSRHHRKRLREFLPLESSIVLKGISWQPGSPGQLVSQGFAGKACCLAGANPGHMPHLTLCSTVLHDILFAFLPGQQLVSLFSKIRVAALLAIFQSMLSGRGNSWPHTGNDIPAPPPPLLVPYS